MIKIHIFSGSDTDNLRQKQGIFDILLIWQAEESWSTACKAAKCRWTQFRSYSGFSSRSSQRRWHRALPWLPWTCPEYKKKIVQTSTKKTNGNKWIQMMTCLLIDQFILQPINLSEKIKTSRFWLKLTSFCNFTTDLSANSDLVSDCFSLVVRRLISLL